MGKKHILFLILILFLPWLNLIYSYYADEFHLDDKIPANKCVQLAKLNQEKRSNLVVRKNNKNFKQGLKKGIKVRNNIHEIIKKKEVKNVLIVGDSLGEGLYIAYYRKMKKRLSCVHVKFLVKHSTTTRKWLKNPKFTKELKSGKYDTLIVVLGANESWIDKITLYYNINKFYMTIKDINPDIDVYWIVPRVKNKNLRKFVEECVGRDKTIAIEDYLNEIPLSKDNVHPDSSKEGYTKLWNVVLKKIHQSRDISCTR